MAIPVCWERSWVESLVKARKEAGETVIMSACSASHSFPHHMEPLLKPEFCISQKSLNLRQDETHVTVVNHVNSETYIKSVNHLDYETQKINVNMISVFNLYFPIRWFLIVQFLVELIEFIQ